MAAPRRFELRVALGRRPQVQTLAAVVSDIGTACSLAGDLQRMADRNEAVSSILGQQRSRYLGEGYEEYVNSHLLLAAPWLPAADPYWSARLERQVGAYLREGDSERDAEITVEGATFSNPLEIVILAGEAVTIGLLQLIRDWPARRRLNTAEAGDYENTMRAREQARQIVLSHISSADYSLTRDQIDSLLAPRSEDALRSLGDHGVDLNELDPPAK